MTLNLRQQRALLWTTATMIFIAAALCLAVGFMMPARLDTPSPSRHANTAANTPADTARLHPVAFQQLWSIDLQRPLYDVPKVEIKPPAPPPPPPLKLRLLGTIIEPGNSQAILQTSDNRIEFKRTGDTLENATILAIKENQIDVRYHEQPLTLTAPGSAPAPGS